MSSRDLHWSLHATKEIKDVNLSSLRMLLLADRANPCKFYHITTSMYWVDCSYAIMYGVNDQAILRCFYLGSLSACDAFISAFEMKGLKAESLCPCASSSETLTIAIRR